MWAEEFIVPRPPTRREAERHKVLYATHANSASQALGSKLSRGLWLNTLYLVSLLSRSSKHVVKAKLGRGHQTSAIKCRMREGLKILATRMQLSQVILPKRHVEGDSGES